MTQTDFFERSIIKDETGKLIPMYHGTTSTFEAFDPAYTGKGNDQYGTGFYFSSNKESAKCYTESKSNKPGTPRIIEVYLNICNPIVLDGARKSNLGGIMVAAKDVKEILRYIPGFKLGLETGDFEKNLLGDYLESFWEYPPKTIEDCNYYIDCMVEQYYSNADLLELDSLCRDYPTELRFALQQVLGYDGVIIQFKDGFNAVSWFPEQIKLVTNQFPTMSVKINE